MLNSIIVEGRLTHAPELKFFAKQNGEGGSTITSFSIATHSDFNREETYFFKCACFGKLAEIAETNLHKGMLVTVKGYLKQKKYTRGDGTTGNDISIVAERLYFQPRKPEQISEPIPNFADNSERNSEQVERLDEADMYVQADLTDDEPWII